MFPESILEEEPGQEAPIPTPPVLGSKQAVGQEAQMGFPKGPGALDTSCPLVLTTLQSRQ